MKEIFEKINEAIKQGIYQDIKFEYDEENSVLNVYLRPVVAVEYITVNLTVTPTGIEFIDNQ